MHTSFVYPAVTLMLHSRLGGLLGVGPPIFSFSGVLTTGCVVTVEFHVRAYINDLRRLLVESGTEYHLTQ